MEKQNELEGWRTVSDYNIEMYWRSEDTGEEAVVNPDWYQDNGTPIDSEGIDMVYIETRVKI